ncbi:MAG TPA: DUF1501 domain-containing protein [Gemmatimonadaceae bacterium]|jgi:uncharacterized protein (DUF1501 family)|nr:DUF1501 domain-containing protein [Gemmatimonadaceae bacterium]
MTEHDIDCGCQEYNELTRRQFLERSAGVSAAALFPAWLPKIVMAKNFSSSRDIIVSVFQRGGADGLSLAVPFADANYYTSRTSIAIPRPDSSAATKGINLDGFFMFPQAMAGGAAGTGGLMPAFQGQDLLIVHATGQLNNSRSHFDAQRYMEVGKPVDPSLVTGWLGRHLASIPPLNPAAPLRGIGIANGLQKTLVGGPLTLPIADPTNYSIGGSSSTQAARIGFLQGDYAGADDPVGSSALSATNTIGLLKSVNFTGYAPANGAVYPNSSFGRALRSVAALIKNNVGIEAAQVDIGNWDTHSDQDPLAGSMFKTMQDFSNSLGAFYADVIATGQPVTVVVVSEFGRNVRENGSGGTDHGRGTTMFAMGKGIAGGRVLTKNWPGLARENLDSGQDLKVTVDYRDILSEIVQNRLGNSNLGFVFPSWTPTMLGVTR